LRFDFGKEGIPVEQTIALMQDEIRGLPNAVVQRAIIVKLQTLTEKHNERVLSIDVEQEQFSDMPWKKQLIEVLSHTYFTITFRTENKIQKVDGYAQSGGSFFSGNEKEAVTKICRSMHLFFYQTLIEYPKKNQTSIKQGDIQEFVSFVNSRLFKEALAIASAFPWHLWFWAGIEKTSSMSRMRTSPVPLSITRLFFISIASLQRDTDISINKSEEEYYAQVNIEKFREARVKINYICNQWYFLSNLVSNSSNFSSLEVSANSAEDFSFSSCLIPKFNDGVFARALQLNAQRANFSGGYLGGFSWFFARTYLNMLFSHYDKDYEPGPAEFVPISPLSEVILPLREKLLRDCGIEPEYLLCLIVAYANFFNNWIKKIVLKKPDFIPFFTLDSEQIGEIDSILGLSGLFKFIKDRFSKGFIPKKYDVAPNPTDWSTIVLNIHDKLSIGQNDIKTLDISTILKPYMFYKFRDGEFAVCCTDFMLGLDKLLFNFGLTGEFGRVKGKLFEEIASFYPSSSGWLFGRDMKIGDNIGRKIGTDLDIILLKPPYLVLASCKTEGCDKLQEINNQDKAVQRWETLKVFMKDIDDIAAWLQTNYSKPEVARKVFASMQSAGQKVKESTVNQMLKQVKHIIPVVLTPGIEYIMNLNNETMLTDWIPRICTPKELTIFLDKPLLTVDFSTKDFVLSLGQKEKKIDTIKQDPNWRFVEYVEKEIAFVSKPKASSEITVFDVNAGVNFLVDLPEAIPTKHLSQAQIYSAGIRVFNKKRTEDSTDLVYKFELVSVKTPKKQESTTEFVLPPLYQPTFNNPVTQKIVEKWNQEHPERKTDLQIAPRTMRKCKECGNTFARTDEELVKFLEPIYPTAELEEGMKKASIENRVGDSFLCSRCDLQKRAIPRTQG
jgi:hypothetical protein